MAVRQETLFLSPERRGSCVIASSPHRNVFVAPRFRAARRVEVLVFAGELLEELPEHGGRTVRLGLAAQAGQSGDLFRIGHFGYFSELDIIRGLAALEMTLERLGHPVKRGAAVGAAEGVFQETQGS